MPGCLQVPAFLKTFAMRNYLSPEQLIEVKIKKHKAIICYLVLTVIGLSIVVTLFFGLVSLLQLAGFGFKPSLIAGMASLYAQISPIFFLLVIALQLLIYLKIEALMALQRPYNGILRE